MNLNSVKLVTNMFHAGAMEFISTVLGIAIANLKMRAEENGVMSLVSNPDARI